MKWKKDSMPILLLNKNTNIEIINAQRLMKNLIFFSYFLFFNIKDNKKMHAI